MPPRNPDQKSSVIMIRSSLIAVILAVALGNSAQAQIWSWKKLPDPRGEFVRLCAPHMVDRWAHPEAVCSCLHDHAVAAVDEANPDRRALHQDREADAAVHVRTARAADLSSLAFLGRREYPPVR